MLFTPSPLSLTVTPSRTPSPLERDVLYGRPLRFSDPLYTHVVVTADLIKPTSNSVCVCVRARVCKGINWKRVKESRV